jgi:hypothetical protein
MVTVGKVHMQVLAAYHKLIQVPWAQKLNVDSDYCC